MRLHHKWLTTPSSSLTPINSASPARSSPERSQQATTTLACLPWPAEPMHQEPSSLLPWQPSPTCFLMNLVTLPSALSLSILWKVRRHKILGILNQIWWWKMGLSGNANLQNFLMRFIKILKKSVTGTCIYKNFQCCMCYHSTSTGNWLPTIRLGKFQVLAQLFLKIKLFIPWSKSWSLKLSWFKNWCIFLSYELMHKTDKFLANLAYKLYAGCSGDTGHSCERPRIWLIVDNKGIESCFLSLYHG